MNPQKITVDISDGVALITISNPPLNSLPSKVMQELGNYMDQLGSNSLVKVIIITGTEKAFATGADIEEMGLVKSASEASAISKVGQSVFTGIEQCPKPVIAAIKGFCLGGGLELALSCHMRFASDKSIFGMPEIQIGLLPAFGGSYRLPAIVGTGRALQMIFTAQKINSSEALALRLVNNVFPSDSMLEEVQKIARQMTKFSSATMRLTLETILRGRYSSLDKTMEAEAEAVGKLYDMHDLQEGVHAWLEKRKPDFTDF